MIRNNILFVFIFLIGCSGEKSKIIQDKNTTNSSGEVNIIEEILSDEDRVINGNLDNNLVMENGEKLYKSYCASCHMYDGKGVAGVFPPLANSDYMLADIDRAIKTILNGTKESIIVNKLEYSGSTMTPYNYLSDEEISAISTYIFNSWGNQGETITTERVSFNR